MTEEQNKDQNNLTEVISKLINAIIALIFIIVVLSVLLYNYLPDYTPAEKPKVAIPQADSNGNFTDAAKQEALKQIDTTNYWKAPDELSLAATEKEMVLYGKELVAHTALYYGPNGKVFKNSTNGMNCQNCHLNAGTTVFGNNYSAVAATYPKYRARSGSIENIYKRVNDCFERSLNGKAIDTLSKEMQAIVAYIKWIGKDVPKGKKPAGSGLKELAFLERAADPHKGQSVYVEKCQSCHQANGEGLLNAEKTTFTYPPLWGPQSYNDGAGLYRLGSFAKFVKYNMPQGVMHNSPQLSDEEAWDVAAFVNSQPRPKKDISQDWPKISEKPFDHPFGLYTDGFSEAQHKYGPFGPIAAIIKKQKKEK
ncbi:MAG: cytochrome c class [Bacteroidetes bacterium]|jgi:thiosulfate dehydrogenase|nr:cytochrome c class [Bacteroidota bacterium]MDF2453502.1 cytochrome c class [Bacteroidota bacterium]